VTMARLRRVALFTAALAALALATACNCCFF
jgi:hypothetical protein